MALLTEFMQAVSTKPVDLDSLVGSIAKYALQIEEFETALTLFKQQHDRCVSDKTLLNLYITAAIENKELELARSLCLESLEVYGLSVEVLVSLAKCERLLGCFERSIAYAKQAIEVNSKWSAGYEQLVISHLESQEFEAAADTVVLALSIVDNKDLHNLLFYSGYLKAKKGDYENAVLDYASACSLEPSVDAYWYNLANCLQRLNRHDESYLALAKVSQCFLESLEVSSNSAGI
jgi:tetratricopeptide (TPR) repeat protein